MNNNVNAEAKKNVYEIPEEKVKQMLFGVTLLGNLHLELIEMYEKESELKKSHKAYLHVRDKADEMCKKNKVLVPKLMEAISNPREMSLPAEAVPEYILHGISHALDGMNGNVVDTFDAEKCRGCLRYDDCEEYFMQKRADHQEEDSEILNLIKEGMQDVLSMLVPDVSAADEEEKKQKKKETSNSTPMKQTQSADDNFNLPAGMVMMSTETLGTMQDDMLQLTESLEQVAKVLKTGANGQTVLKEDARRIADQCANLSHEVFQRWDNADFIAIA